MTNKLNKSEIGWQIVAVLAILAFTFWVATSVRVVFGSAPSGLPASVSTSSTISVGSTSAVTLFTTVLNCSSRVITTNAKGIMLSFGSTTPTGVIGHLQSASTTVAYDSGIYGCGMVTAYGYEASASAPSTTISLVEFN